MDRDIEHAVIRMLNPRTLEPSELALTILETVYGHQARRWVEWRLRERLEPALTNQWPADLEVVLDHYAERVTAPLRKQLVGQFRSKPAAKLKDLERTLCFDREDLLAAARIAIERPVDLTAV